MKMTGKGLLVFICLIYSICHSFAITTWFESDYKCIPGAEPGFVVMSSKPYSIHCDYGFAHNDKKLLYVRVLKGTEKIFEYIQGVGREPIKGDIADRSTFDWTSSGVKISINVADKEKDNNKIYKCNVAYTDPTTQTESADFHLDSISDLPLKSELDSILEVHNQKKIVLQKGFDEATIEVETKSFAGIECNLPEVIWNTGKKCKGNDRNQELKCPLVINEKTLKHSGEYEYSVRVSQYGVESKEQVITIDYATGDGFPPLFIGLIVGLVILFIMVVLLCIILYVVTIRIQKNPDRVVHWNKDDVHLNNRNTVVTFDGLPGNSVKWFKGNHELMKEDSNTEVKTGLNKNVVYSFDESKSPKETKLLLQNDLTKNDCGEYTCVIKHKYLIWCKKTVKVTLEIEGDNGLSGDMV